MGDNPEEKLTKKIKHYQKTVSSLLKGYESLLQKKKSTHTTGNSDHPVKQSPLVNDANKRLRDIDLALELIQQQLKHALEQYLSTQSDLPSSVDCSTIQTDANQMKVAKVTINQQVKPSDDNNGQNEAELNPTFQVLFTGTLPDDFYLHLMSVMGIQECLTSNRLVCSFWNELVLDRCNNQKSLKLFETFDNLMKYGEFLLKYEKTDDTSLILKSVGDDLLFEGLGIDHDHWQLIRSLNPDVILTREKKFEASKVLTTFFPKVEQLVLCTENYTFIDIEHILQFYAKQLTSLTMNNFGPSIESPSRKLRAFNFPLLKSLNIFNILLENYHLLSLLPQLESLTMSNSKISLETLLRTGTQLRELNINYIESVYTEPGDELSKRLPIITNLRKLTFGSTGNMLQALEFISLNLTSLECLKLYFDNCGGNHHLHSVISYLVPLYQLHSLTLQATVSDILLDDNQIALIKRLPSVRHLKLLLSSNALSMDLFPRAIFTVFPNVEQVLIAYDSFYQVYPATLAALEDLASKHPNIVRLFRSKEMSRFTNLPNAVSPLLGHHGQVYEEYIEEEELFGVAICKLSASLVPRQGIDDGLNLKITLRPSDRLTAMSNLFQLLESDAFAFTSERVRKMIDRMVDCALTYGPSQVALFIVTCKCVLFLLDCSALKFDKYNISIFSSLMLQLVAHYHKQQFKEEDMLLQIHNSMDKLIKMMLNGIHNTSQFEWVIHQLVYSENRVEAARALLRVCSRTKNCFRSF